MNDLQIIVLAMSSIWALIQVVCMCVCETVGDTSTEGRKRQSQINNEAGCIAGTASFVTVLYMVIVVMGL